MHSAYTFHRRKQLSFLKRPFFSPSREGFSACPGGSQNFWQSSSSLCPGASRAFGSGRADPALQAPSCRASLLQCSGLSPVHGCGAATASSSPQEPFPALWGLCRWQAAKGSPRGVSLIISLSSACRSVPRQDTCECTEDMCCYSPGPCWGPCINCQQAARNRGETIFPAASDLQLRCPGSSTWSIPALTRTCRVPALLRAG